jgi:hypothetical protein
LFASKVSLAAQSKVALAARRLKKKKDIGKKFKVKQHSSDDLICGQALQSGPSICEVRNGELHGTRKKLPNFWQDFWWKSPSKPTMRGGACTQTVGKEEVPKP